jgi:hypothetical protein
MKALFSFLVFSSLFIFSHLALAGKGELGELLHVPANVNAPYLPVEMEQLKSILGEDELSHTGTIEALVIRPKLEYRERVSELTLSFSGVMSGEKEDKHGTSDNEHTELEAVSLIRFDVSDALGDVRIPGDNIHVKGLRLGEDALKVGDILKITDSEQGEVKAILLKTHVPHHACFKFLGRSGQLAFDLVSSEGQFENGLQLHNEERPVSLNGHEQRLRGVKLAVLKEGTIQEGDRVAIIQGTELKNLISELKLNTRYSKLLTQSKTLGELHEKQYKARRDIRSKVRTSKK